ncbi:hypothetical protein CHLNCDRAFT_135408 [Chlorella variabilis]|uniref:EGF-like domain-containing protein n=1 Tax=Chlorella variabilis TaxID=554065 RepID=E1ZI59_CHLVA|nr:hypothetical protein CHLNCDRAFT_135408 [Chlorella variabilis]EFN54581.1 hypothetical protein CHLNCDRAFT_135408 [Chlorella variabilis]|eukprot:XP_005846683.1 hypothetical protein CHLNCDRAFT_135408 [Chlorella variabilis]
MQPRTIALLAAFLALVITGAAAKCTKNKDGCARCHTGNHRCAKCFDTYGLTPKGTCAQCKVPGKLGWTCVKCDGPRQDVCQACDDWEGEQPTGVYVTVKGRCKYCKDKNCDKCAPKTGICRTCNRGYGLVKGACIKCRDENCITCNRNTARCTLCYTGYAPNPMTGRCDKCKGAECEACKPGKPRICTECNFGYKLSKGRCVKDPTSDRWA